VIGLSANAMPRDIERGMAAGFRYYLTKPLDVQNFLDIINQVIENSQEQPQQVSLN
jgi:CheY-like chemotaxis protein